MGVMEKNPRNTRKPRKTRETKPSTTQPKTETAEDHVKRWEPELATRKPPNQNNEENDLYEEIATEVSTTDIKTQSSRPKRRTAGSICRYVSGTTRPKKKMKPSKNTRVKKITFGDVKQNLATYLQMHKVHVRCPTEINTF